MEISFCFCTQLKKKLVRIKDCSQPITIFLRVRLLFTSYDSHDSKVIFGLTHLLASCHVGVIAVMYMYIQPYKIKSNCEETLWFFLLLLLLLYSYFPIKVYGSMVVVNVFSFYNYIGFLVSRREIKNFDIVILYRKI